MKIIAATSRATAGKYKGNYCLVTIFYYRNEKGEEVELDLGCPPLGTLLCDILNNDYYNIFNPIITDLERFAKDSCRDMTNFIEREIRIHQRIRDELNKQNTEYLHNIIDNVFISENNRSPCCSISQKLYLYVHFLDEIEFNAKIRLRGLEDDSDLFVPNPSPTFPTRSKLLDLYREACLKTTSNKDFLLTEFDYELSSVKDLIKCCLLEMGRYEIAVKKCANCGKYFVPLNRSDTIYCDNLAPQDKSKTCKKYGAEKRHQEKLKNNEAMGLYRKIYMSKQMLAKRNPDIRSYTDSFEMFKLKSKQWKVDIKSGTKAEEDYIDWLKQAKEKKVL